MFHIYFGDGKGKTTAAAGSAIRAAGQNMKVLFAEFLKDGTSGECSVLRKTDNITFADTPSRIPFTFLMTPEEKTQYKEYYKKLLSEITPEKFDLIVFDEILDAFSSGIADEEDFIAKFLNRGAEIIITGRNPSETLLRKADYITHMEKLRHPYDKGEDARKGIEY